MDIIDKVNNVMEKLWGRKELKNEISLPKKWRAEFRKAMKGFPKFNIKPGRTITIKWE